MNLLYDEFVQKLMVSAPAEILPKEAASREEKIAVFNKKALEAKSLGTSAADFTSTLNFKKKLNDGISLPLSSLSPLRLVDLEVDKTHRGRVVFGRIVTDVMEFASIMVLIEDQSAIVDLAVYGDKYATKDFSYYMVMAINLPSLSRSPTTILPHIPHQLSTKFFCACFVIILLLSPKPP